jgi:hypothetical protein
MGPGLILVLNIMKFPTRLLSNCAGKLTLYYKSDAEMGALQHIAKEAQHINRYTHAQHISCVRSLLLA